VRTVAERIRRVERRRETWGSCRLQFDLRKTPHTRGGIIGDNQADPWAAAKKRERVKNPHDVR
jgi:hypothetical protein